MKVRNIFLSVLLFGSLKIQAQVPDLSATGPTGVLTNPMQLKPVEYSLAPVPLLNYERTWVPQKPEVNEALVDHTTDPNWVLQATTYGDGAGNNIQSISRFGVSKTHHGVSFLDPRGAMNNRQYSFLPYSVPSTSGTGFRSNPFTEQESFYNSHYPNEGNSAFTQTELITNANGERKAVTYQPGKSMVGQKRGNTTETKVYDGLPVLYKLQYNSGSPDWTGLTYASGELFVEHGQGQHDKSVYKYSDQTGKVIATRVLVDVNNQIFETTYYLYDELDRLVFTISPKATEKLENNSWNFTPAILNNLCSWVIFDDLGRTIENHTGGKEGNTNTVYDKFNRPVMIQTPNNFDQNQWMIKIYDDVGRICMQGLLNNSSSRSYWQYVVDGTGTNPGTLPSTADLNDPGLIYTYLINGFQSGASMTTYPSSIQDLTILSYLFYDHYNHSDFIGFTFNTNFQNDIDPDIYYNTYGIQPQLRSMPTRGMLTGMKERVIKSSSSLTLYSDWTTSINYYDNDGILIQSQNRIEKQPVSNQTAHVFLTISTSVRDFKGRNLRQITYLYETVNQQIGGVPSMTTITNKTIDKFIYEPKTFKLLAVKQKINTQDWMPISTLTYHPQTGLVSNKNLGSIENQALNYNIRGQLIGINSSYAEVGTPIPNVTFGESIKYDYGFTEKRFDGLISGILWKTPSTKRRSYGYQYSQTGQLLQAEFNEIAASANQSVQSNWNKTDMDLSLNEVGYDLNGNITGLKRKGPTDVTGIFDVDDLIYSYADADESNRLEKVEDLVSYVPPAGAAVQDFQNGNSGSSNDYNYDKNGNILSDQNKDVTNIEYSFLDKPLKLEFSDGAYLEFIYTASGRKIEERKDLLVGNSSTRDFFGSFEYHNEMLDLIHHSEGHARLTITPAGGVFVFDYFVRDHLGNVRTTVTAEETSMLDYLATHEVAAAGIEHMIFDNIDLVRAERPGSTPTNEDAAELDASRSDKRIGTSLLLRVMPGDKFGVSAQAYYSSDNTDNTGTVSASDMLQSIVSTLITGTGTPGNPENGQSSQLVNGLFNQTNYINTYQSILNANTNPNHPRSYINYIVFDNSMRVIPGQSGAIQVGDDDNWHVLQTLSDIEIEQAGYVAIYVSNETAEKMVYFDNINIKYYKGRLLEENHYYPYGMALTISQAEDYQQKELYQTKELIRDRNLNIYDFEARQYDPILGRFMSNDPMNQFVSGYIGMGNNPVSNIDPTGMLSSNADYYKSAMISALHTQDVMFSNMFKNDKNRGMADEWFTMEQKLMAIQSVADEYIRQAEERMAERSQVVAQQQHHQEMKDKSEKVAKDKGVILPGNMTTGDYEGFLESAQSPTGAIIVGEDGVVEDWGAVVGTYEIVNSEPTDKSYPYGSCKYDGEPITSDVTLLTYEVFFLRVGDYKDHQGGVKIQIGFKDSKNLYSKYELIQVVRTSDPLGGATSPYNDPQPPDDSDPFYYTSRELPSCTNKSGFDIIFEDSPSRYLVENNWWIGELSFIGYDKGAYHHIETIRYGFAIWNSQVYMFHFNRNQKQSDFMKSQYEGIKFP